MYGNAAYGTVVYGGFSSETESWIEVKKIIEETWVKVEETAEETWSKVSKTSEEVWT